MKSLDILGKTITWKNFKNYCKKNLIEPNSNSVIDYFFWLNRPAGCTDIMVRYQCACGGLSIYQCEFLRKSKTGGFDILGEASRSFHWDDICVFAKENGGEENND